MKIVFLFILIVLMAGCATFQPKPITPSQKASAFEARTLDNPDLRKFLEANLKREVATWPLGEWDFPMLTLVAFYYHPDLDVARAKWGVARAGIVTAGGRPNPSFSFLPRYDLNPASGASPWYLSFSFDIPIETAGKRGYRIAQAKHLSEAARLNIATVAWQVRSRLQTGLLTLYAANQSGVVLKRQLSIQENIVKLLEKRLTVGEASRPDVTLAHISLDQIRLSLKETQKQSAEARVQVADAIGLPVNALNGAEISFSFFEELPKETPSPDVRRYALLNRPDILSALTEYAASQSALQFEIAKQYPDLHLGPGYVFDEGQNKWGLGISVTLPIFNQNQGPIAEAEARRKQTEAHFAGLQAQVIGEIDRTLAGYGAALQKLEVADSLLADRQKQLQSVEATFKAGEADRLALVSTQLELESSKLARFEALIKVQESKKSLEDALQRPLRSSATDSISPDENPRAKEDDIR